MGTTPDNASRGGEPIAVVGMACRFPGADGLAAFWDLLAAGVDAIGPMPADRGLEAHYDPAPGTPGRFVAREGGFLKNLDRFDAAFFGISPREAVFMDPQQRLLLELAWEAFEDAGIVPDRIAGSKGGVFVGMWTNEYEDCVFGATPDVDLYVTTGTGRYAASGRLSYAFDLRGASMTVDTACSSSLVAIHLACHSLRTGESDVALAAGVNLILQPHISIGYSRSRMLSPGARCRFGDARADGYVRSEGAGLVVLKPLSRALSDGDSIRAVILGSAVNNDGRGSGLLVAPSSTGQEAMLRDAYRNAGVSAGDVQYVEAHGTGTRVGDPVELEALSSVLSTDRAPAQPCLVGSVKTNIGHAEAASGIAGFIKTVLAMERGLIPPSLHIETPNPSIPWASMPMTVARDVQPWPSPGRLPLAGVNSFGVTGTNAHIVLEGFNAGSVPEGQDVLVKAQVLPVSARTPDALVAAAASHAAFLRDESRSSSFADVCYTAAARRTHHEHRLAVVARTAEDAAEQLEAFIAGEPRQGTTSGCAQSGPGKVVFVFPGQGSQWLGMGRALLKDEPVFRQALERCDAVVRELTGWSVVSELTADAGASRLKLIDVVQPTLFSIQVALAALWRSWGINPDAVVGHSMGEIAAAHVAGALTLEDAATIICRRSALLRRTSGQGAMAVVELSRQAAEKAIEPWRDRLSVAVSNSSRSTVLSGDPGAVDALLETLEARGIFCRRVNVDVASHSPQMDPLREDLMAQLAGIAPCAASVPFCSTVLAHPVDGEMLTAEYWARNLRQPVLFGETVGYLMAQGHRGFIEMSPHPLLVGAVQEMAAESRTACFVLPSGRRDEDDRAVLLSSLGALHCAGAQIGWNRVFDGDGRVVPLPPYPWQRERFWYEVPAASGARRTGREGLLGAPLRPSQQPGAWYWEADLARETLPSLADHQVGGALVVPGALYIELMLAAAGRAIGTTACLEAVAIGTALVVPETGFRTLQIAFDDDGTGAGAIRILSAEPSDGRSESRWVEHASAVVRASHSATPAAAVPPATLEGRCSHAADTQQHYAAMTRRGLDYGPAFRGVRDVFRGRGELLARIGLPAPAAGEAAALMFRIALLDACFQALVAALPATPLDGGAMDTFVPVGLDTVDVIHPLAAGDDIWCHAQFDDRQDGDSFHGDLRIIDRTGSVLIEARGLRLFRIARERDALVRNALHHLAWRPQPRSDSAATRGGKWLVTGPGRELGADLVSRLTARGYDAVLGGTPDDADFLERLNGRTAVHVCATLTPDAASAAAASTEALRFASAVASTSPSSRLWFITSGSQAVVGEDTVSGLAASPIWGVRSVAASEYPVLQCSAIDVGDGHADPDLESLVDELLANGPEHEIAFRGAARFVRRLVRGLDSGTAPLRPTAAAGRPYRVVTSSAGILDGLSAEAFARRAPAAGEVEIEVEATGLNFINVMSALGVYPGAPGGVGPLGIECSGRIVRIGEGVKDFQPGDAVMAFAHGSLASHAVADQRLVARIPPGLDCEQAATILIAFLTARYALVDLGRIAPGDRVLIHSATGGVGMAALQIARLAGAEVFATAGSEAKRSWLRAQGIEHVFDSRSVEFAAAITAATGGEGVDVVLNSLAGAAIPAGLSLLREGGRFLEIGKRDIYENRAIGLFPFSRNLSYSAIDLDRLARERPGALEEPIRIIARQLASGELAPLPATVFSVADVVDAFQLMARGGHTGKIVIRHDRETTPIRAATARDWSTGTCLITGGTGGLGLEVARWMAGQGSRSLALVSRRGEDAALTKILQPLRDTGVTVAVIQADVSQAGDVSRVLGAIDASGMPLLGIVHAAGILDDATIARLDTDRFTRVLAPKIAGAWHLHEAVADRPLDFFVLFSSVTSFIGSAGQANYACGNAFLDGLAAYRRARNLPCQAINWGPWSRVGLAAEDAGRGGRLAARGLESLTPEVAIAALAELIEKDPVQAAVMPFDARRWCDAAAGDAWPLFKERLAEDGSAGVAATSTSSLRESLERAPAGRRRDALIEDYVRQAVARVLRLAPARVDITRPLQAQGLDSLMGLELRNRLEAGSGVALPATVVFNYPSVALLAPHLAERMGFASAESVEAEAADDPSLLALLDELEQLPEDEARALVGQPLEAEGER